MAAEDQTAEASRASDDTASQQQPPASKIPQSGAIQGSNVAGREPQVDFQGRVFPFPSDLEVGTDSSDQSTRDDDSAIGESVFESTVSMRSSIYNYIEENGRTYHAYNSGKYMLPNDEKEQDRLAQEYPEAEVVGTDLSPIQPQYVPPNCVFEVDDAEDEWNFSRPFDYIHARAIVTCFKDNRDMLRKIYDNLEPGGYFELQDPCLPMLSDDGTLDGTELGEWNRLLVEGMSRIGRDLSGSQRWGDYMREAGFEDVTEHRVFVAVNSWPRGQKNKLLGAISLQNLSEGIASLSTAVFARVLGWSKERIEVFLAGVRNDLKDKKIHAYGVVYFAYGRKPGGTKEET
ncbi:putative methyltransferase domain-containing protein [Phaeoacremonium minimum UCRPA7]|uniref:Putative methyltransferase domain-containing protein n=1 Tax=Phaeoacremonium minimum (strain UCR-PA7) TaxID=1286976 RepID=R8BGD0_PHAM7|nr:putative methyltransferase domain-containing protein [Phaeoacremonium minimum UCRPA7]EON98371.1 putative methyltransferase domain-containing protein [Phaeoacremonium minimum UCRPA7]